MSCALYPVWSFCSLSCVVPVWVFFFCISQIWNGCFKIHEPADVGCTQWKQVCYSVSLLLVELFKELSVLLPPSLYLHLLDFLVYEQREQTVTICYELKLLMTMSVLKHLSALNILSIENKNSRKSQQQWHWEFICLCSKRCKIQASRISNCIFPFKKKFAFAVANSKFCIDHCQNKWQNICM